MDERIYNGSAQDPAQITETESTPKSTQPRTSETRKRLDDALEQSRRMHAGTLRLSTPIRAHDQDVKEIRYNFEKLTGMDFADAMDTDRQADNKFRISDKQALALFGKAVETVMPGEIDMRDVLERISAADAVTAVQLATVFFLASTNAGARRITRD